MPTYIYLNDADNNTWQIGVNDNGTFLPTPVAPQTPAPVELNDADTNTTTWLLGAEVGDGAPKTDPELYDLTQPVDITLISPSGYTWVLQVHQNGQLFAQLSSIPGPLPGLPCGIPGNITVSAGAEVLNTITINISATGEAVLFADALYQYANLDLPFSPNDPGLFFTYQNTDQLLHKTLAARFFNLMDEYSDPVFFDVGAPPTSGATVLAECLDVRSFGAVGDGITDDTVAVQAAFDKAAANYSLAVAFAASGGASGQSFGSTVVCIPSGVYCAIGQTPNRYGYRAILMGSGTTLQVDGALIQTYSEFDTSDSAYPALVNEALDANIDQTFEPSFGQNEFKQTWTGFGMTPETVEISCSDSSYSGTITVYGIQADSDTNNPIAAQVQFPMTGGFVAAPNFLSVSYVDFGFTQAQPGTVFTIECPNFTLQSAPGAAFWCAGDHDLNIQGSGVIQGGGYLDADGNPSGTLGVGTTGALAFVGVTRLAINGPTLQPYDTSFDQGGAPENQKTQAGVLVLNSCNDFLVENSTLSAFIKYSGGFSLNNISDSRNGNGIGIFSCYSFSVANCAMNNGTIGIQYLGTGVGAATFTNNTASNNANNGIFIATTISDFDPLGFAEPLLTGVNLVGNQCNGNGIGIPTTDYNGFGILLWGCLQVVVSSTRASNNAGSPVHTVGCTNCNINGTAGAGNGLAEVTDSTIYPSTYGSHTNPELDQLTVLHAGIQLNIGTAVIGEVPDGTVDGVNHIFTLASSPVPPYSLDFFIDTGGGPILQMLGVDYTLEDNTITTTNAPPPGATLSADYTIPGSNIGSFVTAQNPD